MIGVRDFEHCSVDRGDRGQSAYGARPPLGFYLVTIFFGNSGNMTMLHIHPMHFSRKYEASKSKTETLRDENLFLELKVRTTNF